MKLEDRIKLVVKRNDSKKDVYATIKNYQGRK